MISTDAALTDDVLALTRALIARPSVSPEDGGCQDLLIERLERAGFAVERMRFGPVDNFWAEHVGKAGHPGADAPAPRLVFAGHTDVVPPGPSRIGIRRRSNRRCATATSMDAARPT